MDFQPYIEVIEAFLEKHKINSVDTQYKDKDGNIVPMTWHMSIGFPDIANEFEYYIYLLEVEDKLYINVMLPLIHIEKGTGKLYKNLLLQNHKFQRTFISIDEDDWAIIRASQWCKELNLKVLNEMIWCVVNRADDLYHKVFMDTL